MQKAIHIVTSLFILAATAMPCCGADNTHSKDSCKTVTLGSYCFKMGAVSHKPPFTCLEFGIRRIRR